MFSKSYRIDYNLSADKTADFNVTQTVKGIKVDCVPEWDNSSQVQISHTTYTTNDVFQYINYQIFLNETCKANVFIEVYGERLLTGGSNLSNSTLTCTDDVIENFVMVITSAALQVGRPINRV